MWQVGNIRDSNAKLTYLSKNTKYWEEHLDVKPFPYLHLWGFGGWHYECEMSFAARQNALI